MKRVILYIVTFIYIIMPMFTAAKWCLDDETMENGHNTNGMWLDCHTVS